MYVQVQVPEQDLAAVYELLARSASSAAPQLVATPDNGSHKEEAVEQSASD